MLLAKINPTAKLHKANTPFDTEVIEANFMTAMARPYTVGAAETNFEVAFGTLELATDEQKEKGEKDKFHHLTSTNVVFTAEELSDWGTDDSVLLEKLATKLGTAIVESVQLV